MQTVTTGDNSNPVFWRIFKLSLLETIQILFSAGFSVNLSEEVRPELEAAKMATAYITAVQCKRI